MRPVAQTFVPDAVRNTVDNVGDKVFGDQGSGNRTKAAVAAAAVAGGVAAAGGLGVLGAKAVAPGLAAATGQTAAQVAAVAGGAVSTAVPAGLAAATSGTGLAASGLTVAGVLGGVKTVASGVTDVATTAALVKSLTGSGAGAGGTFNIESSAPVFDLPPTNNTGNSLINSPMSVPSRTVTAPTVEVTGKADNTFWILLAVGSALIWRL